MNVSAILTQLVSSIMWVHYQILFTKYKLEYCQLHQFFKNYFHLVKTHHLLLTNLDKSIKVLNNHTNTSSSIHSISLLERLKEY